jgi:hypothetical protein
VNDLIAISIGMVVGLGGGFLYAAAQVRKQPSVSLQTRQLLTREAFACMAGCLLMLVGAINEEPLLTAGGAASAVISAVAAIITSLVWRFSEEGQQAMRPADAQVRDGDPPIER